jgi:hypothetical protein
MGGRRRNMEHRKGGNSTPTCGYGLPAYILAAMAEGWNGTLVLKIYRHRGQYFSVKKDYY